VKRRKHTSEAVSLRDLRQRPEEKERFYLLPGQGGSGYRRKQRFILKYSIIVGIFVSAVFAAVMYFVYRVPR
jgi:hypothetical protein